MEIEIWSDVVCPFCYIGKRHLEAAIAQLDLKDVNLVWRSFQLDPTVKDEDLGKPTAELLAIKKDLTLEELEDMFVHVKGMGQKVGLDLKLSETVVTRTINAHRLLHWAQRHNKMSELKEAFLRANFTLTQDLNDFDVLAKVCEQVGLPKEEALAVLHSNQFLAEVEEDQYTAQQFGIRGVPYFVFNRKYALSGAQPIEAFVQTIQAAAH
jgi:predicted DsbA family dithiol-disulfide isomerase